MTEDRASPDLPYHEGARIREVRKSRGLSMKALAQKLGEGVHFTTIAKLETGKMRLSTDWLFKIAAALDVTPLSLIWEKLDSQNVKAVPLFASNPWPPEVGSNGDWVPLGHSPSMFGSEKAFAVALAGPSDNYSDEPLYQVVIDPALHRLRDGEPFAFNVKGHVRVGIYRDGPARFEQWLSAKPGLMLVGTEPFELLGRIVWLGRDMFG